MKKEIRLYVPIKKPYTSRYVREHYRVRQTRYRITCPSCHKDMFVDLGPVKRDENKFICNCPECGVRIALNVEDTESQY